MMELLLIPALIGVALAVDFMPSLSDLFDKYGGDYEQDEKEPPLEVTLESDVNFFDGTEAREDVQGNLLDNVLRGGGGDDVLAGNEGADTLEGGDGDDRLIGGEGEDLALGGQGNDRIFLGDGHDASTANYGNEDAGDDFIRGGAGRDLIADYKGSNQLFGDLGRDQIIGIDGLTADGDFTSELEAGTTDTLHGGYGDDTIIGDDGDHMTGGVGDDLFVVATAADTPGAPVVMADFNAEEDMFSVVFMDDMPADTSVDFQHDSESNSVSALVDGRTIAVLNGLTEADIPFIQTYVTTLPDLLAQGA